MSDADLVLEAAKRESVNVITVETKRIERGDRSVVEPVYVRRVQVVLDDVAEVGRRGGEGGKSEAERPAKLVLTIAMTTSQSNGPPVDVVVEHGVDVEGLLSLPLRRELGHVGLQDVATPHLQRSHWRRETWR